jgi:hypothetical protein
MLATDLLHMDCVVTLQRLYCLFVMEVGFRYVHIPGITANPDGPWTTQKVRSLLVDLGDRAGSFRILVRDRAGHFTSASGAVLAGAGIERVRWRRRADLGRTPPSAAVVRRFLEFYGAGPKIASMAVNILARQFKVPLRDHHFVDISIDRQVRRMMIRLGLVPAGASDLLLIYAAREAYAEFPGIFDLALWRIGRTVCRESAPRCDECPLADLCGYAATMN